MLSSQTSELLSHQQSTSVHVQYSQGSIVRSLSTLQIALQDLYSYCQRRNDAQHHLGSLQPW